MKISIFRKVRTRFSRSVPSPLETETSPLVNARIGGNFYKVWSWTLPILLGGMFGWFGMTCLEVVLDEYGRSARPIARTAQAAVTPQETKESMVAFLRTNPFRVTPMAPDEEYAWEGADGGASGGAAITGSLATAIIRWTLPNVGVYLEDQGQEHLIMVGSSFDVYTLEKVTYLQAVFSKGEERVVKDLIYLRDPVAAIPANALPRTPSDPITDAAGFDVMAAEPNGSEGTISREMVNRMMENPFDELKNIRIRPDKEEGMQVQWINKDSVLNQLGVKKGDVIRGINGIAFKNVADITNSMNSLMNSDRFDVDVRRDGQPISLKYVVR